MEIEMTVKGLMIDPITNMPIIVLRDGDGQRILPIWVGVFEANAIALQIENVQTPRPMTHDLLKNVIDGLDARVERIVVCDLRDNTFYAAIHVSTAASAHVVDARPSDAIALALRTGSPIFVDDRVIESARAVDSTPENMDVSRVQKWLEGLSDDDLGKYKM
jgi:bifunctional DNase/RNase